MSAEREEIAELLWQARVSGRPVSVPAVVPSLAQAYDIQRTLHCRCDLPVMVWKLGLTAEAPRAAFGSDSPVVGRLPSSAIYCDRGEVAFAGNAMFVEAELVFELGWDLPPERAPYDRGTVAGALKGIYAGIEIVRSRFAEMDLPLGLLVADNVVAHGLVLGRKLSTRWDDGFADMPVTLQRNGEPPVSGSTAWAMGNPLDALVWIANWLCENGEGGLRREQLVASGTCTGATEVFAGDRVSVDFAGAGGACVSLLS